MDIYLELRITAITQAGIDLDLTEENKKNSVRWKKKPVFCALNIEKEGTLFDLYPVGVYQDPNAEINLRAVIVKAVLSGEIPNDDNSITIQIGGFVPRGNIKDIPLHITTDMEELDINHTRMNPLVDPMGNLIIIKKVGIDNINPMEAGIRAELNGYLPWIGNQDIIATAVLEHNVVNTLYDYKEFKCNQDLIV